MSLLKDIRPDLVKEIHPTLNAKIIIEELTSGSGKKIWWLGKCNHQWESRVADRVDNRNCPYCGMKKLLIGFNDFKTRYPEISEEWDSELNGTLSPSSFILDSRNKYKWLCNKNHSYSATPSNRVKGHSCPYCAKNGGKALKGENTVDITHPEIITEWDFKNNNILPSEIKYGSNKIVSWKCSNDITHPLWKDSLSHRTTNKRGCPKCGNDGGFKTTKDGFVYFIENKKLNSFKIGISNVETKKSRIKEFEKRGWELLHVIHTDGKTTLALEKLILKWVRESLCLPIELSKESVGRTNGWTETFSNKNISPEIVIEKLNQGIH